MPATERSTTTRTATSFQSVRVRVPATSANLGPGFDSFGIALGLFNTFTCTPAQTLSFTGVVAGPTDGSNLFALGYAATARIIQSGNEGVYGAIDVSVPDLDAVPLTVDFDCAIPPARGLGSSSALIVGGAVAANALLSGGLSTADLLQVCTAIEGHPDNVAPALFGQMTVSFMEGSRAYTQVVPLADNLKFAALIPDFELATSQSRAALPARVPFADAVFNVGRGAGVALALQSGDIDCLRAGLDDRLHQPYRSRLIPGFTEISDAVRALGAIGVTLSGAGPTLLTVWDREIPDALSEFVAGLNLDATWVVQPLEVSGGAQVERARPVA